MLRHASICHSTQLGFAPVIVASEHAQQFQVKVIACTLRALAWVMRGVKTDWRVYAPPEGRQAMEAKLLQKELMGCLNAVMEYSAL